MRRSLLTGGADQRTAEEDTGLRGSASLRPRLLALVPAAVIVLGLVACALFVMGGLVAWKLGLG